MHSAIDRVAPVKEQIEKKTKWTSVAPYQVEKDVEKPKRIIAKGSGNVFTWKDEKGKIHASNVEIPHDHQINNLTIQKEVNTWGKETPIEFVKNQVVIPIVLSHKGKAVRTKIILDTGASHTVLSNRQLAKVRGKYVGNVTSTVADGGTVRGQKRKLDYIQVGPFIERNFEVTGQKKSWCRKPRIIRHGLLETASFHH